jgi:MFS family permease
MSPSFNTLSSLKKPGFIFYLGMFLSQMTSHNMRTVAQSLLIYRLTGSVTLLGILSLTNAVPGILLPLAGGVIADRLPKKHIINIGQFGALFPTLIVGVSLSMGWLSAERSGSWWILIVAAFLHTIIFSITSPARQAIISELVGKDHILNAVSLRSTGYNVIHLVAPAFAGVIIDKFGFSIVYYIMSGFSLIGLIFALFLPHISVQLVKVRGAFSQIKDGIRYLRGQSHILFIIVFYLVTSMLFVSYSRLLPIYVDDILKVGATGYGLLLSFMGIGGIVGSLIMASLPSKKRGLMFLIDIALLGLGLMIFAFSRNWYLSLAILVFVGLAQPARNALSNSLVQSYTDSAYQGRVMSIYLLQDGVYNLGGFLAAMVAGVIGTPWTVGIFAFAMVILSSLTMVFFPRIRKLD